MMIKIIQNVFWLGFERLSTVLGTLLITIYTAKFLGPEKMGVINFALALTTMITPIGQLGCNTIVFNRIAKKYKSGVNLLLSTEKLRFFTYIVSSIFVLICCALTTTLSADDMLVFVLIIISGFFSSQDLLKVYYDATLKSKVNSISSQVGLVASLILRLVLVKANAALVFFTLPYIINTSIPFLIKRFKFSKENKSIKSNCNNSKRYNSYILKSGLPLVISGVSVIIYQKIGQIILGNVVDMKSVGIYNAALTLSTGWAFIPFVVMTSLLPKVISDNKNQSIGFSFIHLLCILLSLPFIFLLSLYNIEILTYTYGDEFIQSSLLLPILSVSTLFSVIGTISTRYVIARSGYRYVMFKTIFMACFNIVVSIFLIQEFGVVGAAYSILITELFSSTIANYIFKNASILKIHLSIPVSFRYVKKLKS